MPTVLGQGGINQMPRSESAENTGRLYVSNVPIDWSDFDVYRVFKAYGNGCRHVQLCQTTQFLERVGKRNVFVTMWDVESAQFAKGQLHEQKHIKHQFCDVQLIRPLLVHNCIPKPSDIAHKQAADLDKKTALRDVFMPPPPPLVEASAPPAPDAKKPHMHIVREVIEPGVKSEVLVCTQPQGGNAFCLSLVRNLPALRDLQLAMCHEYGEFNESDVGFAPTVGGTLVAVWRQYDCSVAATWHRACVITLPLGAGDGVYMCECLDSPGMVYVKSCHMRPLIDNFTELPAQLIPCTLANDLEQFSCAKFEQIVTEADTCYAEVHQGHEDKGGRPIAVTLCVLDKAGEEHSVSELMADDERVAAGANVRRVYEMRLLRQISKCTVDCGRPLASHIDHRIKELGLHKDQEPPASSAWLTRGYNNKAPRQQQQAKAAKQQSKKGDTEPPPLPPLPHTQQSDAKAEGNEENCATVSSTC